MENYYLKVTGSTIKFTYVRSVPEKGSNVGKRNSSNTKLQSNISRAKTEFLDLGQANAWEYMACFTSGTEGLNYTEDIRGFPAFIHNFNCNNHCKIKYLAVFELGEKAGRLHSHVLLKDVPESFLRPYTPQEYRKLPTDVKRLYSQHKTETGTNLCTCPAWKYGWSTIVPTDGSPKVVSYMTKYMTKGNIEFTTAFGGHAFFSSHGLNRSENKKIPSSAVGPAYERIPEGTWYREFSTDGIVCSTCYILDKDKISSDLWDYYISLYESLQGTKRIAMKSL